MYDFMDPIESLLRCKVEMPRRTLKKVSMFSQKYQAAFSTYIRFLMYQICILKWLLKDYDTEGYAMIYFIFDYSISAFFLPL